ncbi:MAG: hypothetical protein OXI87_12405 [Albidovulum sp.]|nr:hypothetical protein [Albidovulum sp.]
MAVLHFDIRNRFSDTPEHIQNDPKMSPPGSPLYWRKLVQVYVVKVVWYGLVTLLAAQAMRLLSA